MKNVLMNEIELKGIYGKRSPAYSAIDIAHNLGYELGASSISFDRFSAELDRLEREGVIEKVYDFGEGNAREALYNFVDEPAQISLFGHSLYYNH